MGMPMGMLMDKQVWKKPQCYFSFFSHSKFPKNSFCKKLKLKLKHIKEFFNSFHLNVHTCVFYLETDVRWCFSLYCSNYCNSWLRFLNFWNFAKSCCNWHEIIFQDWDLAYKLINSANHSGNFWKFIIVFVNIILVFDALFRLFLWLHH